MLAGNLEVLVREPTLSTPAPLLEGIPSVAFLIAGGASRLQSSLLVAKESLFPLLMPKNFNYPRVEDNSSVSPLQSISPM